MVAASATPDVIRNSRLESFFIAQFPPRVCTLRGYLAAYVFSDASLSLGCAMSFPMSANSTGTKDRKSNASFAQLT